MAALTGVTVAVCIPSIPPREHLLWRRALPSVRSQTHDVDETIIRIDTHGRGAGHSRNVAWRTTTTDFVAFLDDDDEFMPQHVERCLAAAVEHDADVVYPWFELVGWDDATTERPDPLATKLDGELVHPLGVPFGPEQAAHLEQYAWIPSTILIRRALLVDVDGYPELDDPEDQEANGWEDWGLLKRALRVGAKFVHVPERTWVCHLDGTRSTAGRPWTSVYDPVS